MAETKTIDLPFLQHQLALIDRLLETMENTQGESYPESIAGLKAQHDVVDTLLDAARESLGWLTTALTDHFSLTPPTPAPCVAAKEG